MTVALSHRHVIINVMDILCDLENQKFIIT